MKYVSFLDIMGFKETLRKKNQNKAKEYIDCFSTTVYEIWNNSNTKGLKGHIVSDSFIIYTDTTSPTQLEIMMNIIITICKAEFTHNSILIRGGLAKGEFDKIPAKELNTLSKNLIVGQAYIDAYLLESASKSFGISIEESVYKDLDNCNYDLSSIIYNKKTNKYIIRYIDIDYLLKDNNLYSFINLAKESNWLPHYYNALGYAIKNERNYKKIDQLFYDIISIICNNNSNDNYPEINTFIENAFADDVDYNFKSRLLRFIRQRITK